MTPDTVAWWAEVATKHLPHVGARILAAPPDQRLELAELFLAGGLREQPHLSQMTELLDLLELAPPAKARRGRRSKAGAVALAPAPSMSPLAAAARDLMHTQWGPRIFRLVGSYRDEAEAECQRFLAARAAILEIEPRPVSLLEGQLFLAGLLALVEGAR